MIEFLPPAKQPPPSVLKMMDLLADPSRLYFTSPRRSVKERIMSKDEKPHKNLKIEQVSRLSCGSCSFCDSTEETVWRVKPSDMNGFEVRFCNKCREELSQCQ